MKIFSSSFSSVLPPQESRSSSRFPHRFRLSTYLRFRPYQMCLRLSDHQMSGPSFHPLPLVLVLALALDSLSVQCCQPLHPHFDISLHQEHPAFFLLTAAKKSHQKQTSLYRSTTPPLHFRMEPRRNPSPLHRPVPSSPRFVKKSRPRHWPLHRRPAKLARFVTSSRPRHWPAGCPAYDCRPGGSRGCEENTRGPPG